MGNATGSATSVERGRPSLVSGGERNKLWSRAVFFLIVVIVIAIRRRVEFEHSSASCCSAARAVSAAGLVFVVSHKCHIHT